MTTVKLIYKETFMYKKFSIAFLTVVSLGFVALIVKNKKS